MKTILYVDDEPVNLELFRINYSSDYHVLTALSGPEGLEKMEKQSNISIIFSDMKMPEMNGLEFIQNVKRSFPDIPCYILTGYDITPEIKQAINSKIIRKYYQKPLNFRQIKDELAEMICD